MARLTGIRDIGSKQGAIGYLTERRLDREALTESAVLMAMVPRIRRELCTRGAPHRLGMDIRWTAPRPHQHALKTTMLSAQPSAAPPPTNLVGPVWCGPRP